MRIKNIASGSSGNATYIGTETTHILVDCGIPKKRIIEGLEEAELSLSDIDAVLVTHEHWDHISGLGVLERSRHIPLFTTKGTFDGISRTKNAGEFDRSVFTPVGAGEEFSIGDIRVKALGTFHDAAEPVCYKFSSGGKTAAIVTDLGDYDEALVKELAGLDGILLEANHDVRMLQAGRYPYSLKQRILGRYGHLSNESSGRLLNRILHDEMKYILLGHVSHENNTRELARLAVETEIEMADNPYRKGDFEIKVASRSQTSLLAEF